MINHFIDKLNIKQDDTLLITGNTIKLLRKMKRYNKAFSFDLLIDKLINKLGKNGTLIIQTFNWDFCELKKYDIINSKSKTGSLGSAALKRKDFVRTNHPIYSFAVTGKYKEELKSLTNKGAFDKESPFNFLFEKKAEMIIFDLPLQNSFTFVHYVEEMEKVNYRYNKSFTSKYINDQGTSSVKTYHMYVRDIKNNILTYIEPLEELFRKNNAMDVYKVDNLIIRQVNLHKAYHIIEDDIRNNNAKSLYKIGEN
jgi:aminoglycoside 3-N-acetyltransferase